MPSRRSQIELTPEEIAAYLAESKTLICSTNGPRGAPHVVPLWFVMRGTEIWGWSFAKSQKTKNLERDPRATLLVEDGVSYDKLRSVMMESDVEIVRDPPVIREFAIELFARYGADDGSGGVAPEVEAMIDAQLPKRVALRFTPTRYVSWDHRKLGGTY